MKKNYASTVLLFVFIFSFFFAKSFSQTSLKISTENFSVEKKNYVRGEILFQLKKSFSKKNFENIFQKKIQRNFSGKIISGKISDPTFFIKDIALEQNIFLFSFNPDTENENDVLQNLRENEMVETAQFNYNVEARTTTPNDSLFNQQWYLKTIKATQAWDFGTGGVTPCGDTIVVAILDRGFDPYIKEFAPNLWKNRNEIPNNGIDDDNNGLIDDYVGYNFFSGNDDHTKLVQENDAVHGTLVTGLIGAAGNNKSGIAGVNWNVKLMILSGVTNEGVIISAYSYAIKMRKLYNDSGGKKGAFITATSMSLGLPDGNRAENHPLWCSMYDSLGHQGILNFVAATNSNGDVNITGDMPSLCSSDYILSINHTDSTDTFVPGGFSTKYIAFSAPGANIITTSVNNTFDIQGGNSLAAPLAVGSAALLYAVRGNNGSVCTIAKTNPSKIALQIRDALITGLDKIPNLAGKSRTGGRLNLYNSVQQILTDVEQVSLVENMLVYPNPAADNFTLVFPSAAVTEFKLFMYDAAGRIVKSQNLRAEGLPLNISVENLPTGFYSLMCVTDKVIYRQKLVIEKR